MAPDDDDDAAARGGGVVAGCSAVVVVAWTLVNVGVVKVVVIYEIELRDERVD